MFHRLFTARGIVFKPATSLARDLRYHAHEHGERIAILYAGEEPWSKRYRDRKLNGQDATVLDQIRAAVGDLVGDESFVWMGNTDLSDGFFAQTGAARLPNTPHGLNGYQGYHNVVALSALNPPLAHFGFMEGRGINGEEMRTAHYRTAVYQAVMRCSIRNPDDATPKRVVVMDRDTAEWLADLFPGAKVEPLPGMGLVPRKGQPGRRRKHASNADRVQAHREQEKRKLLAHLDLINGTSLVTGRYPFFDQEVRAGMREVACNEKALKEGDIVTPQAAPQTCGTAFGSIRHVEERCAMCAPLPTSQFEHALPERMFCEAATLLLDQFVAAGGEPEGLERVMNELGWRCVESDADRSPRLPVRRVR
ncbi:hypothetical protein [Methylobacterium currus]|nr:hypothetical protein [Methylobacterium currus]